MTFAHCIYVVICVFFFFQNGVTLSRLVNVEFDWTKSRVIKWVSWLQNLMRWLVDESRAQGLTPGSLNWEKECGSVCLCECVLVLCTKVTQDCISSSQPIALQASEEEESNNTPNGWEFHNVCVCACVRVLYACVSWRLSAGISDATGQEVLVCYSLTEQQHSEKKALQRLK